MKNKITDLQVPKKVFGRENFLDNCSNEAKVLSM